MKSILKVLLLLTPLIFVSGCQGCDDGIKLIKACSWKTDGTHPCVGSGTFYDEVDKASNIGICQTGTLRCRQDTERLEDRCPDRTPECLEIWENERTDTICVGYIPPKLENCHTPEDDDCDGQVNEGFDLDGDGSMNASLHQPTPSGFMKACGTDCDDNNPDVNDTAQEICDGIDNNCNCTSLHESEQDTNADGVLCGCTDAGCDTGVDEGINNNTVGICIPQGMTPQSWQSVITTNTPCSIGKLKCLNGETQCLGAVGPEQEICDGIDNNCDGSTDEHDAIHSSGDACGSDIGMCEQGYLICDPVTKDMLCVGAIYGYNPDHCDAIDNDCDGEVDEEAGPVLCTNGCPISGYQYCVDGDYTACNAPHPGDEALDPCNGLDDDCDGQVDEGQECQCDPAEVGPNAPDCTLDEMVSSGLTCGKGKKNCICENGDCQYGPCYLACDPWVDGAPDLNNVLWGPCDPEDCDAWDHNCWDGPVDGLQDRPCDCDPSHPVPEIALLSQEGNGCEEGACTAGSQSCELDQQTQAYAWLPLDCDAVAPLEEICDEVDNDCDGLTDEELNAFDRVDMVFAIDVTGSMDSVIEDVHAAISAYAQDFQQTEHRFSLVLFPAPYNNSWAQAGTPANFCGDSAGEVAYWNVTGGLVPVGDFLAALNLVLQHGTCCASEPSYDVLSDLTNAQDPAGIGWRNDAYPYIFLLGDEEAQTWTGLTEQQVGQQAEVCDGIGMCPCNPPDCQQPTNEFEVHCFTAPVYGSQYDEICYNDVHGDNVYNINLITAEILRGIFADICLPANNQP